VNNGCNDINQSLHAVVCSAALASVSYLQDESICQTSSITTISPQQLVFRQKQHIEQLQQHLKVRI